MKPKLFNFSIYQVGRKWGGEEEGGWTYKTYELLATIRCKGKMSSATQRYQKKHHNMKFNFYSVEPLKNQKQALNFIKDWLDDDENIVMYAEKKPGQNQHLYQHYE